LNESFLFSGLHLGDTHKGFFFRVTETRCATIISPRFNLLAGDCVLGLADSPCEYIYLFGSCGGMPGMVIGDMVIVEGAHNFESFSDMLRSRGARQRVRADARLTGALKAFFGSAVKRTCDCATVNSLLLEERYAGIFKKRGISCVDMESSLVLNAARHTGKKAAALMYVSDIIGKKPLPDCTPRDRQRVEHSRQILAGRLAEFIRTYEKQTCA
jgi:purine-nucleoside phosphorylase